MLRVVLYNSSQDSFDLDLYENSSVNLNLQQEELRDLGKSKGSFSQTFRIPLTKANQDFFGNIQDTNVVDFDNYAMERRIPARLYEETELLYKGFVQIKGVYVNQGANYELDVTFFTENLDLFKSIGDKKLNQLSFGGFENTTITEANIDTFFTASHNGAPWVRYGQIDRGKNFENQISFAECRSTPTAQGSRWRPHDMTPFYRCRELMNKICQSAGFSIVQNTWYNSDPLDDLYLMWWDGTELVGAGDVETYGINVYRGGGTPSTSITGPSSTTVPLYDNLTGAYDLNSNWNNSNHYWTCPANGTYTFQVKFAHSTKVQTATAGGSFRMYVESLTPGSSTWVTIAETEEFRELVESGIGGFVLGNLQGYYQDFSDTQTIQTFITSGTYLRMRMYGTANIQSTALHTCRIVMTDVYQTDAVIELDKLAPDMKQKDFIAGMQKMFNLVIDVRQNDQGEDVVEFTPWNDYMDAGTTKDWSAKIDYTKDIVITGTSDVQAREYEYTHKEGQDFLSQALFNSADRVYGRHLIEDPENDFAVGEESTTSNMATAIMSVIPGTDIPTMRLLSEDGEAIKKPVPRLAYYRGAKTDLTMIVTDSGNTTQQVASRNEFGEHNDTYTTLWGMDTPFAPITQVTSTLFNTYWRRRFLEKYSREARIMEAYFILNRVDILEFKFNDTIYAEGAYWRVVRIDQYPLNEESHVKVTLSKVLSIPESCGGVDATQDGLFVTLTDDNGVELTGDLEEECCEFIGFTYNNGRCRGTIYTEPPIPTGGVYTESSDGIDDLGFFVDNNQQVDVFRGQPGTESSFGTFYSSDGVFKFYAPSYESYSPELRIFQPNAGGVKNSIYSGLKAHQTSISSITYTLPGKLPTITSPVVSDSSGQLEITDVQFRKVRFVSKAQAQSETFGVTDSVLLCAFQGRVTGGWSLYLPSVTNNEGRVVTLMTNDTIASNKYIVVQKNPSDTGVTIDGQVNHRLDRPYDGIELYCISGQWYIRQRKSK